jgi:hypothetical protein
MFSEILNPLFGCHQEVLFDNLKLRMPFGLEAEFEVVDDPVHNRVIGDESDDNIL